MPNNDMIEKIIINEDGSKTISLIFIPVEKQKGDECYGTNL